MNPKLVAKVKAPDTAGKSSIGTGYPISGEWVLTARHVVDFAGRGIAPITVEWLTHHEPVEVAEVKLLDNDIALLRCVVPVEVGNIPFLPASKLPAERVGWKSAGYPDVNDCELFDAMGAFGVDLDVAVISLTLDDTCRQDKWGGMSGAPVFSGDKFCAVITTHDQRMDKRLNAVSIPWLLRENHVFQQAVKPAEQAAIQESTRKLYARVEREIELILNKKNIPPDALMNALQPASVPTSADMARHLVGQLEAGKAISLLGNISLKLEAQLKAQAERWDAYLQDVEQLCGWLLIKSVDPEWWFQNEVKLRVVDGGIAHAFALDFPAYIEVIISRSLLQPARYALNQYGRIRPFGEGYDVLLFDAISGGAIDVELLTPIYKDLLRTESIPPYRDVAELLDDIELAAMSLHDARAGKIIYYIVSKEYFDLLQSVAWFAAATKRLNGYLQFFCCDPQAKSCGQPPCLEGQKLLLERLATILRLRNPKRALHA